MCDVKSEATWSGSTCTMGANDTATVHAKHDKKCKTGFLGFQYDCKTTKSWTLYCPGTHMNNGKTCSSGGGKSLKTTDSWPRNGAQYGGASNQTDRQKTNDKSYGSYNIKCPNLMYVHAQPYTKWGKVVFSCKDLR